MFPASKIEAKSAFEQKHSDCKSTVNFYQQALSAVQLERLDRLLKQPIVFPSCLNGKQVYTVFTLREFVDYFSESIKQLSKTAALFLVGSSAAYIAAGKELSKR